MTQKGLFDLPLGPGQYTEQSERGAVGRWYSMDKVRFRSGLAEKIGGWEKILPQFIGIARKLRDWSSLDAKRWAAIGTDTKLYLWQDGVLHDITPVRRTVTLTAPFTTANAPSLSVTVTDVSHGAQSGDYLRVSGAIAGASSGILVDGEYQITSIIDSDNYIITVATAATGPGASAEGGTPTIKYDISAGAESAVVATGYGTGGYGAEGYGNARTGSTLVLGIRTWSLDTWGEDLLASPTGGGLYWWDRSKGTGARAELIGDNAPPVNQYMIVSQRDRHVIALGAYDYFNQAIDPMLIRWCSTEDLNDWIPTSTNTAGDLRLYSGSKIVAGVRSRLETLIFTDVSVHTLPFVGGFNVFGLNIVGENVSILGPNAVVAIDSRVIFMAESDFYIYDGIVRVLPCSVRSLVYDNLNTIQRDKVHGGLNREFNEIWFFYPSYDIDGWVQNDLSLGLPSGYSLANASTSNSEVILQSSFTASEGFTGSYIEESANALAIRILFGSSITGGTVTNGNSGIINGLISTGNYANYDLGALDWTIETKVALPSFPVNNQPATSLLRLDDGFGGNGTIWDVGIQVIDTVPHLAVTVRNAFDSDVTVQCPVVGWTLEVEYHIVLERIGDVVYVGWNGDVVGSVAFTGSVAPLSGGDDAVLWWIYSAVNNVFFDETRILRNGTQFGLDSGSTYTVPASDYGPPVAGPVIGDIGYTYGFTATGLTAPTGTADNGYEYDYYLTNDDPILTPREAEYAVEFSFQWDGVAAEASYPVGIVLLREDLTGLPNTGADDAYGIYVECDYFTDTLIVRKKNVAGVKSAMDNDPGAFTMSTVLGEALAYDTKYIITAQVNDLTVTIYLNGIQVTQFALSAAEGLLYTSGSFGLHAAPAAGGLSERVTFYNLAAGPIGVITADDFDISPIEVNRYVVFNYEEGTWVTGKMSRTAWADRSPLLEKPYAAGTDGYLYQHETGTDADGAAMVSYCQSFDMEIPEAGENLMHIDQLVPDFLKLEGQVDLSLLGKKYPHSKTVITKGPYTITNQTKKVSTRIRARQVAIRIESNTRGDKWRMATMRGRAGPHGKRG